MSALTSALATVFPSHEVVPHDSPRPVRLLLLPLRSVTKGQGASAPEKGYASRFFEFINATWPHRWGASLMPCSTPAACLVCSEAPMLASCRVQLAVRPAAREAVASTQRRPVAPASLWFAMGAGILSALPRAPPPRLPRDHVLENKGIGGTSSGVYAACAEQMVGEVGPPATSDSPGFSLHEQRGESLITHFQLCCVGALSRARQGRTLRCAMVSS